MKNPLTQAGIEPATLTTVLPRSPHVSVSYFSFHPANFQTSKSDKWHLSLSHLIDVIKFPIRYTPKNLFPATQLTTQSSPICSHQDTQSA